MGRPSDAKADAMKLLARFNISAQEIVSIDRDSILFLGLGQMPRTAWIAMRDGEVVAVIPEAGFNVEPSGWTRRRLEQDTTAASTAPAAATTD